MTRLIDMSGERYGKLLVKERMYSTYYGLKGRLYTNWKCLCDCGQETVVTRMNLVGGNVKSCGCLAKLPKGEASFNRLLNHYKMNAKKKGRVFELTKEEFGTLTKSNCHYCGTSQHNFIKGTTRNNGGISYNGIDRVDSSIGYTANNCVPCCSICNYAKRDYDLDKFLDWINKVYNNTRRLNNEDE